MSSGDNTVPAGKHEAVYHLPVYSRHRVEKGNMMKETNILMSNSRSSWNKSIIKPHDIYPKSSQ